MNYRRTVRACFVGYIVQAVINNLAPLLFLTFQSQYGIPLSKITLLITVNFCLQLTIDCASVYFIDRIGYRASALLAHFFSAFGLIMLSVLPRVLPDPYVGLLCAVCFYAVGGGLLEVIISPMVEACPTENKARTMSILHSFYCWGSAAVIVLSTLFLKAFGTASWQILAPLWAILPIANGIVFLKTPIAPLIAEGEEGLKPRALLSSRTFWLLAMLMICAGASEQSVSEWASSFAEKGLGISKMMGDLAGPTIFALMMGTSRAIYGRLLHRFRLRTMMLFCGALCAIAYLMVGLIPNPVADCSAWRCAASRWASCGRARSASRRRKSETAARRCSRCSRWRAIWAARRGRLWPEWSPEWRTTACASAFCPVASSPSY